MVNTVKENSTAINVLDIPLPNPRQTEEAASEAAFRAIPNIALSAEEEAARQENEKEEARKRKRNSAYKEWFEFIAKYLKDSAEMIENINYLKENMRLTAAEKMVFEKVLKVLRTLQKIQTELELKGISTEEFLAQPEEEQFKVMSSLYNSERLEILKKEISYAYHWTYFLDKIFVSHRMELKERTDQNKFSVLGNQVYFLVQARVMQLSTRVHMLIDGAIKYLGFSGKGEFSAKHEFQRNISDGWAEIPLHINQLSDVRPLCRKENLNTFNADRSDFVTGEKAKGFLAFLNKENASKVVYFKMLYCFEKEKSAVLKNRRVMKFFRKEFPFVAEDLDKLLRSAKGNSDICFIPLVKGENLSDEHKKRAQESKIPILAKRGIEYIVYGRNDGEWKETILAQNELTKEEKDALFELNFSRPTLLKSMEISENLINFSEKYHTPEKQEKIEKKQKEEQEQRRDIELAFDTFRTFLLNVLEPEFIIFARPFVRSQENKVPPEAQDLTELKDFIPDIVARPLLKESSENNGASKIEVPFMCVARNALNEIHALQALSLKYPENDRYTGWDLIYRRAGREIYIDHIPEEFDEGDSFEILHHGKKTQTVSSHTMDKDFDKEKGVGIEFHSYQPEEIDRGVRLIVTSLIGTQTKEIFITVDLGSLEEQKLALNYAKAILSQGAIPVLLDNGKLLNKIGTLQKLEDMLEKTKSEHKFLIEHYESEVIRINTEQKEDAMFIAAFQSFLKRSPLTEESTMPDPCARGKELTKEQILLRLADITLMSRNLEAEKLIGYVMDYMEKISPRRHRFGSSKIEREEIKKELTRAFISSVAEKPEELPEGHVSDIFRKASKILGPETSMCFDLGKDTAFLLILNAQLLLARDLKKPQNLERKKFSIKLPHPEDSRKVEELVGEVAILRRLIEIALIRRNMKEDAFLDLVVSFISIVLWESDSDLDEKRDALKMALRKEVKRYTETELSKRPKPGKFAVQLIFHMRVALAKAEEAEIVSGKAEILETALLEKASGRALLPPTPKDSRRMPMDDMSSALTESWGFFAHSKEKNDLDQLQSEKKREVRSGC